MSDITYLGTGLLGSAFVEAGTKRGERIAVWNRTIEKARALAQFGARIAESPADAVQGARVVHLVLKDDAVVEEVIAAARPGLAPEAIIVDHTTTQPALTAARSERLNRDGIRYLHCPVFIGPAAARQGHGTVMASGPKALFDAVHDDLARMAPRVEYFGERPDLAAIYKLCGNAFIVGIVGLVADVLTIAKSAGAPADEALKVTELFDPTAAIRGRGRNIVARNFAPAFELAMARKDVRLMIETVGDLPLAALPSLAQRMDALIAAGHGDDDLAVIGIDATDAR